MTDGVPADSRFDRLIGVPQGRRVVAGSVGVGAIALAIACLINRVWSVAMNVPFAYRGDGLFHAAYVKRMRESFWYLDNDRLGAPLGLDARDFPLGGENIHWVSLKILGWFLPSAGASMNVYFLLTYALIAAAAYIACRMLGLRTWTSFVVALLYAFMPYHQWRGVSHLLRSGYYVVPFAIVATLWIAHFAQELRGDGRAAWFGIRRDRSVALIVLGLVLGASDTQHAVYASILLLLVGLASMVASRDLRPLLVGVTVAVVAGASLLANNAPYLLNIVENGPNTEVADRNLAEQEVFSLRPAQLVLPVTNHRLDPLADLKSEVTDEVEIGENSQSLGLLGSVGLIVAIGSAIVVLLSATVSRRTRLLGTLGGLMLFLITLASSQGWSFLLSVAGGTMLRTWNRTSIFIAFLALVSLALLLEAVADRISASTVTRTRAAGIVAVALVAVGVLDQVPGRAVAQSAQSRSDYSMDSGFYAEVEALLGDGAMVYQFPYIRFPEAGDVNDLRDYEQLTGYLHTDSLRWSGAAMEGRRAAHWHEDLLGLGPSERVVAIVTAGFTGAVVYRRAYSDTSVRMEAALAALVGPPAVVHERRGLAFYDLRPLQATLEDELGERFDDAREATLEPAELEWSDDFYPIELGTDVAGRWSSRSDSEIELENNSAQPITVTLSVQIAHLDADATSFVVEGPFGVRDLAVEPAQADTLRVTFDLEPGTSTLRFESDGVAARPDNGDPRMLGLRLSNLTVLREATVDALCSIELGDRRDPAMCSDPAG